jgi:hypothetical protein
VRGFTRSSIVSHVLVDARRAVNKSERNPRPASQKHSELRTVYFQKEKTECASGHGAGVLKCL